jgi:hypothetical protein
MPCLLRNPQVSYHKDSSLLRFEKCVAGQVPHYLLEDCLHLTGQTIQEERPCEKQLDHTGITDWVVASQRGVRAIRVGSGIDHSVLA